MLIGAVDPVAFSIGSLEVRWYGLVIVAAMIVGLFYVMRQCKVIRLSTDDAVELFLWVIPLAIVFARLLYVLPRAGEYFGDNGYHGWDKFVHIIAVWEGGLTIIGGILGGIIGGIFFTLRHKKQVNFGNVADLVVVPLLFGQIVGRLGNFFNQEAFGLPITNAAFQHFPFGVCIVHPSGVEAEFSSIVYSHIQNCQAMGMEGGWFCATFFYEMVWNAIGLIVSWTIWKKGESKKYPGFLLIFYLFWYCLGRAWLESLRMDAVPITQIAMIIVVPLAFVAGVIYILLRNSQLSYQRIASLAREGEESFKDIPLTAFDIKNYAFVGKVKQNAKNPLKLLYERKSAYVALNFDELPYYSVPKGYKKLFRQSKKQEYIFEGGEAK